jgi:hypothetical protein
LRIDAMSAETQLTPRDIAGNVYRHVARSRVLPFSVNPRDGWKTGLSGTADPRIAEAMNKESVIMKSVLRDHSGFKNKDLNQYVDVVEDNHTYQVNGPATSTQAPMSKVKLNLEAARARDKGSVLLDMKEVLSTVGVPNKRQVHDLLLSSAYAGYGLAGEPLYTATFPSEKNKIGTECMDYIFYSTGALLVHSVLSLPLLTDIRKGERPQASCAMEDFSYVQPFHIAQTAFNAPLRKLYGELGIGVEVDGSNSDSISRGAVGAGVGVATSASADAGAGDYGPGVYRDSYGGVDDDEDDGDGDGRSIRGRKALGGNSISIGTSAQTDLLSGSTVLVEETGSVATIASHVFVCKAKVADAKRKLLFALEKSHVAGNNALLQATDADPDDKNGGALSAKKPGDAGDNNYNRGGGGGGSGGGNRGPTARSAGGPGSSSGLWGGKWGAFPTHNYQRANNWLPNEHFASSHVALGAEFALDAMVLSTEWH